MRQRKTDDQEILQLLQEGKNQKEIAQHFGVSPVAIHKRVKRLVPLPESLQKLTEKEQKFCVSIAQGKTQTQAAFQAYECGSLESAKVIGSQLMSKSEIQMTVNELMDYHGLTKSYRVKKLKTHVDNRDPNISLKALDQSWKLDGSYAPEKHLIYSLNFVREIAGDLNELLEKLQECKEEPLAEEGKENGK